MFLDATIEESMDFVMFIRFVRKCGHGLVIEIRVVIVLFQCFALFVFFFFEF